MADADFYTPPAYTPKKPFSPRGYGRGLNRGGRRSKNKNINNYKQNGPFSPLNNTPLNYTPLNNTPHSPTFNGSPFSANLNEDDLNLEELESILISRFRDEKLFIDSFCRDITETLSIVSGAIVADNDVFNISTMRNSLQSEEAGFAGGDQDQSAARNDSNSEVIQTLLLELEKAEETVGITNKENVNSGLEMKKLKATITSLESKLKKQQDESKAQLEKTKKELQKDFDKQMKSEQEKFKSKEQEWNQEINVITGRLEAYRLDDGKLKDQLEEQKRKTEDLADKIENHHEELNLKERQILEAVKEIIKAHCECSICLEIFDDAVTTTCGHTFCKVCIEGWRKAENANGDCPICRRASTFGSIYFFNQVIGQLKVKFPSIDWTRN